MSEAPPIGLSSRQAEERRIVSVWLNRLEELLDQDGALYKSALKRAGLKRETLEETVNLSQRDLDRVLAQVRTRHADITLRLFSRAEILDLGLVGYAAIKSDSVGSALQIMNQYHSLASDRYLDELTLEGGTARVAPVPLPGYAEDFQNICEDSFSGNWRALQLLLGPHANQSEIRIRLPYTAPKYAATYREIFGDHCEFQSSTVGLLFPAEWLSLPIHYGSGALSDVYAAVCERVLGPGEINQDMSRQVRRLLLTRTGGDFPSLQDAADDLRLSAGQLRKRLYRCGTSYKKLALEVRMDLAKHYLMDTALSIQEIAYLLAYAAPAPFSRAFKKVHGVAPQHYREGNSLGEQP
jgi:AraC-like DNA-binding protein